MQIHLDSIEKNIKERKEIESDGNSFQNDDVMLLSFVELIDKIMTPELDSKEGFVFWWIDNTVYRNKTSLGVIQDRWYAICDSSDLYDFIVM